MAMAHGGREFLFPLLRRQSNLIEVIVADIIVVDTSGVRNILKEIEGAIVFVAIVCHFPHRVTY